MERGLFFAFFCLPVALAQVSITSTASSTTARPDCEIKIADIAFLMDASGSVSTTDYQKSLDFIADIVKDFDIGKNKVKVAVIEFSSSATIHFNLDKHSTKADVIAAIKSTPKSDGGTNTNLGLDAARLQVFDPKNGMRPNAPQILFVMTDGSSGSFSATERSAQLLHQNNVTVFAVGIGNANPKELEVIASDKKYIYNFTDFSVLSQIKDSFARDTCEVAVKLAPKPPECVVEKVDIGFIVDSSGSVDINEWKESLDFVSQIVQAYNIGKDKVRVGLVEFSAQANMEFNFNKYDKKSDLVAAILNTTKTNGGTATDVALDLARTTLFTAANGMRQQVPQMLFVITDGQSNDPAKTATAAKTLHKQGINVFSVGVGSGARQSELEDMASDPNFVYSFNDFTKLKELQDTFLNQTCEVVEKLKPSCVVEKADIGFIVDSSGSVSLSDWNKSLRFVDEVVKGFNIANDSVQVGLIEFSGATRTVFHFNKFQTDVGLSKAILNTVKSGGSTNTHLALELAKKDLFTAKNGRRPGVPQMLFVITDGASNDATKTAQAAKALHDQGITVFAIGVGGAKQAELLKVASDPKLVYSYNDFDKLTELQDRFAEETCEVAKNISRGCVVEKADIGFIIDSSGSVSSADWTKSLQFLSNIVQGFDIGRDRVRAGLIEFSRNSQLVFDLNQYTTKTDVKNAISRTVKTDGSTNTHKALEMAKDQLFTTNRGMRPNVPQMLFIITDGESNDPAKTAAAAQALHNQGVTVLAVGVGGAKQTDLLRMASNASLIYTYNDFDRLAELQDTFIKRSCDVAVDLAATTPPPGCIVNKADVAFIVDSSGSVSKSDWDKSLDFVSSVAQGFPVGKDKVRVGLIEFSTRSKVEFDFDDHFTKPDVSSAILNTTKTNGFTYTNRALEMAKDELFTPKRGMRSNVPQLLFVITDGESSNPKLTAEAAEALHDSGVTVFAIGVRKATRADLEKIASHPELIYTYDDFDKLAKFKNVFVEESCQVAAKVTVPSQGCAVHDADIVFVVDTASPLTSQNLNLTKAFLNSTLDTFDFVSNRIGLVQFSDQVSTVFELNQMQDRVSAERGVNALRNSPNNGTNINAALKYLREHSFTTPVGDRPNAPNIAILITDGKAKNRFKALYEANVTKASSTKLFTIGIGDSINVEDLTNMATKPSFAHLAHSHSELPSVKQRLTSQICRDYSNQVSTPATCYCKDKIDDCSTYGSQEDICLPVWYKGFVTENCPVYCDLCRSTQPNCIEVLPPPPLCEDKIKNCALRVGVCTDDSAKTWAIENCAKHCNFCNQLSVKRWRQPATTPATTTTTSPTTVSTTPSTTPFVPCDPYCFDKSAACDTYDKSLCKDPLYTDILSSQCQMYCGYCKPIASCTPSPPPPTDSPTCSTFPISVCWEHPDWVKTLCPVKCGHCPGCELVTKPPPTTTTTTTPKPCTDTTDCSLYGAPAEVCTKFLVFAQANCQKYCGWCTSTTTSMTGSTTPSTTICQDLRVCGGYPLSYCSDADYGPFMFRECRNYCGLC